MSSSNYNFKCDTDDLDAYLARYSKYTLAEFLRKCIRRAITSKAFFDEIYFPTVSALSGGKEINLSQGDKNE